MTTEKVSFYQTLTDDEIAKEAVREERLDNKYRLEWGVDSSFTIYCDDEDEQKTYTRHLESIIGVLPLKHPKNEGCFVSIGLENSLQISLNQGPHLKTLAGHDERVLGLIELDDGSLVSASTDGFLRFWNTKSGQMLSEIETSLESLDQVKFFLFHDIVAIKENDSVSIWKFSGEQLVQLEGQKEQLQAAHQLSSGNWLIWTENTKPSLWTKEGKSIKSFSFPFPVFGAYCELESKQLLIKRNDSVISLFDENGTLESEHQNNKEIVDLFDQLAKGLRETEQFINKNPDVSYFQHARNLLASKKSLFCAHQELEKQSLDFENNSTEQKVWNFFSRPVFEKIKTALKSVIKTARTKEKVLLQLIDEGETRKTRYISKKGTFGVMAWVFLILTATAAGAGWYLLQQPDLLESMVSENRDLVRISQQKPEILVYIPAVLLSVFWLLFWSKSRKHNKNAKRESNNLTVLNVLLPGYYQLIDNIKSYRKKLTSQIPVLQEGSRDLYQGQFIQDHIDELISGKIQELAMNECGLDKDDIIYKDQEPIILPTFSLIQDKERRSQVASKLVFENEYSFWPIKGGTLVSAVQFIQYTFLTKDKIDVFTTYYDFITNKAVGKEANAFYYKDVTNIAKKEVDRDDFWEDKNKDISATEIVLSVASGEKIRLTILNEESLSKIHQQTKDVETISPEMLMKKLEDERTSIEQDDDLSEEEKQDEFRVVDGRIAEAKTSLFELDSSQTSNKADEAIKNIRNQLQQHKKES